VGERADPEFPFGVSRKRLAVRSPSPGHEPPLLGSACPPEWSPTRVAGFWLPAPPLALGARTRWTPGSFPVRLPDAPKSTGPSHGLRLPCRVSDQSLRPTRLRIGSSHGVHRPYDDIRAQIRLTRVCLTRHLPASGFRPSRRFAPCARPPVRGPEAVRGVHPSGLDTFKPAAPVSGPLPSCRFRLSLSSPLRTRR
jgi:hypothetical protein